MPKQTKMEKAKEEIFTQKVAPLMDEISELCDEHNFSLLIAVQLYVNKTEGARVAAQSVETKNSVLPIKLSNKILRGEVKITADTESSFHIDLLDDYDYSDNDDFDPDQLESLQEHAEHCEDCREDMQKRILAGEDVSNVRIIGDHDSYDSFRVDETMLPKMAGFFSNKTKIIH